MKRLLLAGALCLSLVLSGCSGENNVNVGRTGMLRLPDGTLIQGEIEALYHRSQSYYEVTIDGTTYFVHPARLAILKEE